MKKTQLQKRLVDACYYGDSQKVSLCLRDGARPNEPDERGYFPLHMACQEGHFNTVNLLVKNGAKVNMKDGGGKGETPLFRAVGLGHLRIVRFLIKNGCNVNLKRGQPPDDTPLHTACAWGRFREAVELLKAGAHVNALDDEEKPPIYYAVTYGHSEIVAFLIKSGALAASKAGCKETLLSIATVNNDRKTLRALSETLGNQKGVTHQDGLGLEGGRHQS